MKKASSLEHWWAWNLTTFLNEEVRITIKEKEYNGKLISVFNKVASWNTYLCRISQLEEDYEFGVTYDSLLDGTVTIERCGPPEDWVESTA
ncbi:uncharacterized protein SETTUDRAFT_169877 [Exserohilum turcica Et28A]|uniref:Uncharacterized protein n=1 Tax=Exserohilum turcicum (strain 28A) TaxID=671987 RepID=R0KLH3_EXST2|nr:uncharacterized protein SETTUDRAFT_169877 [Exserohilum turcica Et28A]EOA89989.1 hypothetical protein SETTUDRAFT_169877 [Exserohilum turcica Et28A]